MQGSAWISALFLLTLFVSVISAFGIFPIALVYSLYMLLRRFSRRYQAVPPYKHAQRLRVERKLLTVAGVMSALGFAFLWYVGRALTITMP